jgi:hypothetical protein
MHTKFIIFAVFPNFPIFRATPRFSLHKNLIRIITNKKKICQIVQAVIEKSTLNFSRIFPFSGQLFQFFFKPDSDYYKHLKKRISQIGPDVLK